MIRPSFSGPFPRTTHDAILGSPPRACGIRGFRYCFYSGAFLVSHFLEKGSTLQWVIVLLSTAVSGLGAGGLWTAQASFFSSTAKQHARLTGCSIEQANAFYSSVYAALRLDALIRFPRGLGRPGTASRDNSYRVLPFPPSSPHV